jgi:hypothetical protein
MPSRTILHPDAGRPGLACAAQILRAAQQKLANDLITAFSEDFAEHGPAAIERVRAQYLKLCVDLLPKDIAVAVDVSIAKTLTVVEAFQTIAAAPKIEIEHAAIEAGE